MKLVTFKIKATGAQTIGAYTENGYVDLVAITGGELPNNMIDFLNGGEATMARARQALAEKDVVSCKGNCLYSEDEVVQMAPVPRPGKIIHTSCNFDAHLKELTAGKRLNGRIMVGVTSTLSTRQASLKHLPVWWQMVREFKFHVLPSSSILKLKWAS